MTETKSSGLPPATATEEWRVLSAHVAYTLWNVERRANGQTDRKINADAWAAASTDFRVLVRYVLRELEKEGIRLRNLDAGRAVAPKSPVWAAHTARAAWLYWMNSRRRVFPASEYLEAEAWQHVAADQRNMMRQMFTEIEAAGIRFAP